MKKISLLGLLSVSLFTLGACGSDKAVTKESISSPNKNSATTEVTAESIKKNEQGSDFSQYSFEDGLLITPEMEIKIDKTELGHATGEDGLILWFTIKNKGTVNIIPQSELYMFDIKQQDDTSEYQIATDYNYVNVAEMLYPQYNDDGTTVDDETYDKNSELQEQHDETYDKKFYAELMPGKEVKTAIGLHLENTDYPITINLSEPYKKEIQSKDYVINLK